MEQTLLSLGFGSCIIAGRIIDIKPSNSAPMKRLINDARAERRLIDVTSGRRTRSVIIMDSNHVVLSAIQPDTLKERLSDKKPVIGT